MNGNDELSQARSSAIGDLVEGLKALESELSARAELLMPSADSPVEAHPTFLHWPGADTYAAYCLLEPVQWEIFSPAGIGGTPTVVAVVANSREELDREVLELTRNTAPLSVSAKVLRGKQLDWHRSRL